MRSERRLFVRATQAEIIRIAEGLRVTGKVGPDEESGWVAVIHDGDDLAGLLTDRPQLTIFQLPTSIGIVVRDAGREAVWSNSDRGGEPLVRVTGTLAGWFGGVPDIIARSLLDASADLDSVVAALARVCALPGQVPDSVNSPIIGWHGPADFLRRAGHALGPAWFMAGTGGWNYLVPIAKESKLKPAEVLIILRRAAERAGHPAHPFALWRTEGGALLRLQWDDEQVAMVSFGARWLTLGDREAEVAREVRLVVLLSRIRPEEVVRAELARAKAAPGRSGLLGFLEAMGIPLEAGQFVVANRAVGREERLEHRTPRDARKVRVEARVRPIRRIQSVVWGVGGAVFILIGLLASLQAKGISAVGVLTLGILFLLLGWKQWQQTEPPSQAREPDIWSP